MNRFAATPLLLALALVLAACGGGMSSGTQPPPPSVLPPAFVYISNTSANKLTGINVAGGKPAQIGISLPDPGGSAPIGLVATGRLLYVANSGSGTISGFSFDATTGALHTLPGSPYSAAAGVSQLALCPGNRQPTAPRFLYAVTSSSVLGYNITSTGQLTSVPGSPFGAGSQPAAVLTDAACNFVFIANKGSNNISVFSVNSSSGLLTPVPGSPFAAGSAPVALATGDGFLFAGNSGSNNISVYTINRSVGSGGGFLTQVAGSPASAGASPSGLVYLSPTLYVANSASNDVSAFTVTLNTGRLIPVTGSPVLVGANPMAMISLSPPANNLTQQQFLYVANAGSNNLSGFTIGANGTLTVVQAFPFPAGTNPRALVFACGQCGYP
ncbi:MAG TPA: beta-propeller fold lactonase family protein [Terriglobales bacterium]|nr:beta-propeller fold lactonase family protein [Terriglobales bacterium]